LTAITFDDNFARKTFSLGKGEVEQDVQIEERTKHAMEARILRARSRAQRGLS
jgi:hypothetical protein